MIDRSFTPRPKGMTRARRSEAAQRNAQPGKVEAARAFKTAVCGSLSPALNAHHALPASWLKDEAWRQRLRGEAFWAAVYDPRVAISLPTPVHTAHTNRVRTIPYEELPAMVPAYVMRRWGPAGVAALLREHPRRTA